MMEATRDREVTLVDLLDRVLDKGVVLHADVIISVSGIPLIGLKLNALLASVDTMIQYGIWADWDKAIRAAAAEDERRRQAEERQILSDETPVLKTACSCWHEEGILKNWQRGTLYVTDRRILLHRRDPPGTLFWSEFHQLKGFMVEDVRTLAGRENRYLHLLQAGGRVISLHPPDARVVIDAITCGMLQRGLPFPEQDIPLSGMRDTSAVNRDAPTTPVISGKGQ